MTAMLKRLAVTLFTTGLLGAALLYLYTFDGVEKDGRRERCLPWPS